MKSRSTILKTARPYALLPALVLFLLFTGTCLAWPAKVIRVADGDTITVLRNGNEVRVSLHGVDCPEEDQDFWYKAKMFTSRMVAGRTVHIIPTGTQYTGAITAWVEVGWLNLNVELVKSGLGWARDSAPGRNLFEAQETARKAGLGLWRNPEPIAPWEFRQGKRPPPETWPGK